MKVDNRNESELSRLYLHASGNSVRKSVRMRPIQNGAGTQSILTAATPSATPRLNFCTSSASASASRHLNTGSIRTQIGEIGRFFLWYIQSCRYGYLRLGEGRRNYVSSLRPRLELQVMGSLWAKPQIPSRVSVLAYIALSSPCMAWICGMLLLCSFRLDVMAALS